MNKNSEKVKNSFPKKLSADCWATVGQQLDDSRIPEKPQLAGKNIAYRREMKLSHLSPPFGFGLRFNQHQTLFHSHYFNVRAL